MHRNSTIEQSKIATILSEHERSYSPTIYLARGVARIFQFTSSAFLAYGAATEKLGTNPGTALTTGVLIGATVVERATYRSPSDSEPRIQAYSQKWKQIKNKLGWGAVAVGSITAAEPIVSAMQGGGETPVLSQVDPVLGLGVAAIGAALVIANKEPQTE